MMMETMDVDVDYYFVGARMMMSIGKTTRRSSPTPIGGRAETEAETEIGVWSVSLSTKLVTVG